MKPHVWYEKCNGNQEFRKIAGKKMRIDQAQNLTWPENSRGTPQKGVYIAFEVMHNRLLFQHFIKTKSIGIVIPGVAKNQK